MSTPEEVVIARLTNNVAREVRVIRALYPQECLKQSMQPLGPASIVEPRKPLRTYQNTGVQTLPPPNGKIYKLIHGREPSQTDCVRNMGTAAIGRYADDPRSNPYELMYGTAYPAPPTAQRGTHADSEFQTASCATIKKALARAKVKASMTANKYRGAAARAGYVICAESKDEMIIHSEQYPITVQLDAEGNLLAGTVERRYLPNIYGASSQPTPPALKFMRKILTPPSKQSSKLAQHESQDALTEEAPYPSPSQSPTIIPQFVEDQLPTSLERISALIPSSTEGASDLKSTLDDEYGSVGSGLDEFVVYDAGAAVRSPAPVPIATSALSGKRGLSEHLHTDTPSKRPQISMPEKLRKTSMSAKPSADSPPCRPHQNRNALVISPSSDPRVSPKSLHRARSKPGDVGQGRTWTVAQPTTARDTRPIAPGSKDGNERKVGSPPRTSSILSASSIRDKASRGGTGLPHVHDARRHRDTVPTQSRTSLSVINESMLPVTTAVPFFRNAQPPPGSNDVASPTRNSCLASRKRSHSCTHSRSGNVEPDAKRVMSGSNAQKHSEAANVRGAGPTRKPDASPDPTGAPQAESHQSIAINDANINRTASGRIEKKSASRASRISRQPFAPYVPPAMRARAQQASNEGKVRKQSRGA